MSDVIKRISVGLLVERLDTANPNVMSAETFDLLKKAIAKVGFLQPILVRHDGESYEIVDGVHRWKAATELGFDAVPCVVLVDADASQATALRIGMNRMRGDLDLRHVADQLHELRVDGWSMDDLQIVGFSQDELVDLLKVNQTSSPDDLVEGAGKLDKDPAEEREEDGGDEPFILEVAIPVRTRKAFVALKRKLKKAGEGDLGAGVLRAVEALDKVDDAN